MKRSRRSLQAAIAIVTIAAVLCGLWAVYEHRQRRLRQALAAAVNVLTDEESLDRVRALDRPTEVFLRASLSENGARALCAADWACFLFIQEPPRAQVHEVLLQRYRPTRPYPKEAGTVAYPRAVAYVRRDALVSEEEP